MNAEQAFRSMRTVERFEALEAQDLVRMRAVEEQENYFDVYGRPDDEREYQEMARVIQRDGCWCTLSEYRDSDGKWQVADSCGMHTGYRDVLSPYENWYVVDEMDAAIQAVEANSVVI